MLLRSAESVPATSVVGGSAEEGIRMEPTGLLASLGSRREVLPDMLKERSRLEEISKPGRV